VGKKMTPRNTTLIRTAHVGFVVDKAAMRQVYEVLCFSPANVIAAKLYTHLSAGAGKTGSFEVRSTMGLGLTPPQN
jgi:hypothetical protein